MSYIEDWQFFEESQTLLLHVVAQGYRATATVGWRHPNSIVVGGSGSPAQAEEVRRTVRRFLGQ